MPLLVTLRAIRPQEASGETLEHAFDEWGGTIGRAPHNDLVLPDPKKLVSREHAVVEYTQETYYITNTSINGVLINDATKPLGQGKSAPLNDRDHLTLGEYVLEVRVTRADQPRDCFASPTPRGPGGNQVSESPPYEVPPFPEEDSLFDPEGSGSLIPELDKPPSDTSKQPSPGHAPYAPSPFQESVEAPELKPEAKKAPSESPPRSEATNSPSPHGESAPFLPEDWNNLPESESPEKQPTRPEGEPRPEFRGTEVDRQGSVHEMAPFEAARSQDSQERTKPTSPPPNGSRERPRSGDEAAAPRPPESLEEAQRLLQAFLSGAGLARLEIPPEQAAALMEQVGSVLRAMVDGTMAVLHSRSSVKGEFRLAQTTIRPVENNPLKFSVGVDEALERLLRPREGSGYLPPLQATEEAYEDIKAHQLAVMAGMQAALKTVLERFDPAYLERRLEQPPALERLLPMHRKAKSWERFTEHYQEVAREAEDDFQRLFGEAFARTYEEQLRKLRSQSQG